MAVRQILFLWERTMSGRAKDEWKKDSFNWIVNETDRADRERDVHYSKDSRRLTPLRPLLPRYNLQTAGYRFNEERRVDATDKFYFIPSPPLSYSFIHSINPPRFDRVHLTTSDTLERYHWLENENACISTTRYRISIFVTKNIQFFFSFFSFKSTIILIDDE